MTGVALHVGVDTSGEATVATPVGVLSISTAPHLRDVLLKCMAEQPTAVIVDLAFVHVQSPLALSIFGVVARRSADWSGVPLILEGGSAQHGRLNLRNLALSRFVLIAPTLDAAIASINRPPIRRLTTWPLPSEPRAARSARRQIEEACARWDCPQLAGDAAAVADELVSNAIRCAGADLTLRAELRRGLLTVAVTDDCPEPPVLRRVQAAGELPIDGFGLVIVSALALAWGSSGTTSGGKTVWAVLATDDVLPEPGRGGGRASSPSIGARTGYLSGRPGVNDRDGRGRFGRWVDRQHNLDNPG